MYATADDMLRVFGRDEVIALTDPTALGEIDRVILDGSLIDASAEIDSYLAARYRLPLTPTPTHLRRICCNIARYLLTGSTAVETESINTRYQAAVAYLKLVADGKVTLGPAAETGITPSADNSVQFVGGAKVFGRSGPGAF